MISLKDISIVIPIGPRESAWRLLLKDLKDISQEAEIIFAGPEHPKDLDIGIFTKSPQGRAVQLNSGARQASRDFLWFIHADSRISKKGIDSVLAALKTNPGALWYFNLGFLGDGPMLMKVNEKGVWIRSHLMKIPFGDQGFCVSKALFLIFGGYPEDVEFGEDHLFVWHLRQAGVPILCTGEKIYTSSRKYREGGWTRTTLKTMFLTAKQAGPEWLTLLKQRIIRR